MVSFYGHKYWASFFVVRYIMKWNIKYTPQSMVHKLLS